MPQRHIFNTGGKMKQKRYLFKIGIQLWSQIGYATRIVKIPANQKINITKIEKELCEEIRQELIKLKYTMMKLRFESYRGLKPKEAAGEELHLQYDGGSWIPAIE